MTQDRSHAAARVAAPTASEATPPPSPVWKLRAKTPQSKEPPAPERRAVVESRFNEYAFFRLGLFGSVITAVGLFIAIVTTPIPERESVAVRTAVHDDHELLDTLRHLRREWGASARQQVLDAAAARTKVLVPQLARLLRTPGADMRVEGVELAGALGDASLQPLLVLLTNDGDPTIRHGSVRSVDRLSPWTREALVELLVREDPAVQTAALALCALRDDVPWEQVGALLEGADAKVREAARAVVRRGAPAVIVTALWRVVDSGNEREAAASLSALARLDSDTDSAVRAAAIVARGASSLGPAALELLAQCKGSVAAATAMRAVLDDAGAGSAAHARALHGLERVGSFDADELAGRMFFLDPKARYFAARCLVSAGDARGTAELLALAESGSSEASVASRQLLAWMTGRAPGAKREEFERAMEGKTVRRELPAPAFDLSAPPASPMR